MKSRNPGIFDVYFNTIMSVVLILLNSYHILRGKSSCFNWNVNMNALFLQKCIKTLLKKKNYKKQNLCKLQFQYLQIVELCVVQFEALWHAEWHLTIRKPPSSLFSICFSSRILRFLWTYFAHSHWMCLLASRGFSMSKVPLKMSVAWCCLWNIILDKCCAFISVSLLQEGS